MTAGSSNISLCEQEGGRLTSILGYTFLWDRKNDPISPTRGFDVRFGQDVAGIGGAVKYIRTDLSANAYRGLFNNVIASAKLQAGYIRGWGGDDVSINDRYFKGSNDFRGFDTAGVGPRVVRVNAETGEITERFNALGGNAFGLATAEVSFPVGVPNLLGSIFIEAGTVGLLDESEIFNDVESNNALLGLTAGQSCENVTEAVSCLTVVDQLEPRVTMGASVFWESPFGPIRFDFTNPLVQQPFDERQPFQFTTSTRF